MSIHAEIRVMGHDMPLCGYVTHLSATHVSVHIPDSSGFGKTGVVNLAGELSVCSSAGRYVAPVQVQSLEMQTLIVALSTTFRCEQRRRHARKGFTWPAMLRGVNGDGTRGGWKQARIVNISEGGIGLALESPCPARQCELRVELKEDANTRGYDDRGFIVTATSKQVAIQISAYIKHSRTDANGAHLGLAFANDTPHQKALITRLLGILNAGAR